ncbi:LOW QUALITY PROTEIN: RNA polymerase sigma factor, sigma-70 family [Thermobacillus composti KWC4]|uniref:RNA polymerase sigma factor, sigma-70 family n=2 Tax=Thermobacillus TaxID=76632 RepID=L0EAL7_THECK|nr:LOW QUALITY PROTEIN: RNA polymerase sigma factor, sigma-70 family [Thermobacillus composti KWC4]
MIAQERLSEQFEAHRRHLLAAAYRMLGSLSEAEDAVQEGWLRLCRAETEAIENLGGWLTRVVSRVCLDMLRSRKSRREEPLDTHPAETYPLTEDRGWPDPEREALMAESVGFALLVVLDRLKPAERVTFVLHDIFGMPFAEIAQVAGKSEAAVRKLASRARRRVTGTAPRDSADLAGMRRLVDAFIAAARAGDFDALIAMLDPDVTLRDDTDGGERITRGAEALARRICGRALAAQTAVVDGVIGAVAAPLGRLAYALKFDIRGGKIAAVERIADPARLAALDLHVPFVQAPSRYSAISRR